MKSIISSIIFVLIATIGSTQNYNFEKLDNYFRVLEDNNRYFGSIAVAKSGEIIYHKSIGYADIEGNIRNTSQTKFRIGSITKTFTATLIMKAVEMGKIDLDDSIESYFPNINNANKITIRFLLNHRSGINTFTDREFFSWYTQPITKNDLLKIIISKGTNFEPNTKYEYSNSNYVLLTFILEKIFEQSYGQVLEEYITRPLKLSNTAYGGKINAANNEAKSYRMNEEWEIEPEGDMSIPLGAGGITSTPTDLCRFANALFEGKLISNESLEKMKPAIGEEYGFALYEMPFDEIKAMGHGGDIDAFTSTLSYFEEDDISFALTCNGSNYGKHDITLAVLSEVFGKPYELPSFKSVLLKSEDLDQYLGTYESDELPMDMTIRKEGSTLMLEATGQSSSSLMAKGNHQFTIAKYGVKLTFIPSKKIMNFEQQGMKFDLTLKQPSSSEILENENLDQFLGTYESANLPIDLTISKNGNKLIGQGTGQPPFTLMAVGDNTFSNKEIGLIINFIPNEKKIIFEQGGAEFEMTLK